MRALVHVRNLAQRWFMFQNMGPSPTGRSGHAMASNGTRVFVLGGESSAGTQADETALLHVLDTSMCFIYFFILFRQPLSPKTQSTSSTRSPIPTLSNLVTRPNSCARHPRASRRRSNGHHHQRVPTRRVPLLLYNKLLTPRSCVGRSPRRMPALNGPVRMN